MSTNTLILPPPNAILPKLLADRDTLLAHIASLDGATSVENVNALNAALTKCGSLVKQVETYRKSYTAPFDEFKDLCMAQQKECLAPIVECQSAIKQELADYQTRIAQEARDREAKRLAAETAKTSETVASRHVTPALVPMEPAPEVAKVNTRKVARLVISNIRMVPPEYFELNEARLKAFLLESPINMVLGAHIVYDDVVVTGRAT